MDIKYEGAVGRLRFIVGLILVLFAGITVVSLIGFIAEMENGEKEYVHKLGNMSIISSIVVVLTIYYIGSGAF